MDKIDKYWTQIFQTANNQAGDWETVSTDNDGYHTFIMNLRFEDTEYNQHDIKLIGQYHNEEGIVYLDEYTDERLKELKAHHLIN
jgi:hypothetical protein